MYFRWIVIIFAFLVCTPQLYGQDRIVDVCVLNDMHAPVSDSMISHLLEYASAEFRENVGITFQEAQRDLYALDIFADTAARIEKIRSACRLGEVALIFSNRTVSASEYYGQFESPQMSSERQGNLLGLGSTAGYALVTSLEYSTRTKDAAGNPRVYAAVKHELAHLFYDAHLGDPDSFLYSRSTGLNQWTEEVRRILRSRKSVEWALR